MNILDYIGIRKYFSREQSPVSQNTEYVLSSEEKLRQDRLKQNRLRRCEEALNDFPRSNSEIEYVYLKEPIMRAILRDCIRQ